MYVKKLLLHSVTGHFEGSDNAAWQEETETTGLEQTCTWANVGERFSPSYDIAVFIKLKWVWKSIPFTSLQDGGKKAQLIIW